MATYVIQTTKRINPDLLDEQLKTAFGVDTCVSTGPDFVAVIFAHDGVPDDLKTKADEIVSAHDPNGLSTVEQSIAIREASEVRASNAKRVVEAAQADITAALNQITADAQLLQDATTLAQMKVLFLNLGTRQRDILIRQSKIIDVLGGIVISG